MRGHWSFFVLLCCLISACTDSQPEGTSDFIESWNDSENHSAVSYWYAGEGPGHYVILEKWPDRSIIYHVDKGRVRIVGVYGLVSSSDDVSINLKRENIEVLDNAT